MKIGILTFHSVTNYGAVMQCYGVQKLCLELYPHAEVEVINYQPKKASKHYFRKHVIAGKEYGYFLKLFRFWRFSKERLNISGKKLYDSQSLSVLSEKYDAVVVGSDEVWKISKIRGWDENYFLSFVDDQKVRLISYAASSNFGTSYGEREKRIAELLARFSSISVRDEFTKDMIQSLVDQQVTEVLDPTLASDMSELMLSERVIKQPYVLVYASMRKKELKVVKRWAEKNNWTIIAVGHNVKFADKVFLHSKPEVWLNLIQNAELVITHYYHGMLLSLKNNTPVIPIFNKSKSAKVTGFAKKFHFEDKVYTNLQGLEESDFQEISAHVSDFAEALEEHKAKSREYMRKALVGL